MRRSIRYAPAILAGFALGSLGASVCRCAITWVHGGSADPRCVYGWKGYVEIHKLDFPHGERVVCEYRPDLKP